MLLRMFEKMARIRAFEERIEKLCEEGKLAYLSVYTGQEAVAVGVCANLREDDVIFGTHRGRGYWIAKGGGLVSAMAEIFGKRTGACRGVAGPAYLCDPEKGILISSSPAVGAQLGTAVGAALAFKLERADRIAVAFFGDGASNQGIFHEALNLASIWEVPVLFVCENNLYAFSTPQRKSMKIEDVARRAESYKIPWRVCDGMDVEEVYEAALEAVRETRKGYPFLLECKTYRFKGQFVGDPMNYIPEEELRLWLSRDPLRIAERKLRERGVSEEEIRRIWEEAREEVERALREALAASELAPEEIMKLGRGKDADHDDGRSDKGGLERGDAKR